MDKPLKKVQVAALFVSVLLCCWVVRLYASPEEGKPLKDYDAIVIGDFTVEQNEATKDVPESAPAELQKAVLKAVKQRGPFKHVIDKAKDASPEAAVDDAEAPKKRVVLSGVIVGFDAGSRSARMFAGRWGAGAGEMKVRYSYTDAETGTVIAQTEHRGKYYGNKGMDLTGGSEKDAAKGAAKDVGGDVIGDLHKLRGWARK